MHRLLPVFVLLIVCFQTHAQQSIPATIDSKLILSTELSPYQLVENTTIAAGGELIVEPGVTVFINANVTLTNNGRLVVMANENSPAVFTCTDSNLKWKYIYNNGTLIANYLHIERGVRFVTSYGDTVIVRNCKVTNTFGGIGDDLIGAHYANKILIEKCYLEGNPEAGKTDAIDLDGVDNDTIVGNQILNFSDDGIDIGTTSTNIYIANNTISNCNMGISVGETSTVLARYNILFSNHSGIQSHTGSNVVADRNTIYNNREGIRAFHDLGQTTTGATITVINSIISACVSRIANTVANSVVNFNYCLSDSLLPAGEGNIQGDALLFDIENGDFSLTGASPAIDKGNPDNDGDGFSFVQDVDDRDPDGTRLDIGAEFYFNAGLMINEITASNLNLIKDEFNQYPDAIEIFNNTDADINLNGYYFSDSKSNLTKHQILGDLIIQAGGYKLLWADNLERDTITHLSFKLSGEGEFIALSDPSGKMIDGVRFPMILNNTSFGRNPNTRNWVYFETPTFNSANSGELKTGITENPVFSDQGGESVLPMSLSLMGSSQVSSTIKFSTDGADPLYGSYYEQAFAINETTTVRALIVDDEKISAFPTSRMYYPEGTSTLPVFSISTNEEHLYGDLGIYTNYSKGGPLWERPACIGFYNQEMKFESAVGIRIQGGNSVYMPKKSFRLFYRGGYGNSSLDETPFNNGAGNFKNLVLRSGYDDDITVSTGTLLRDPLSAELWNKLGELATKSDFVSLYLNNSYWGIYNIRESINEYFVESNMGINDFDLVRFQKWGNTLKYGSMDTWNELERFFETTDFSNPAAFDATAEFMDMNSFLNLLAFVHCTQFRSWTWGAFGIKPDSGKWIWTIWDTDRAFSILTWNGFTEYANTSVEKWPNIYPQKLLANEQFKNELINRTCDLLNTTFKPLNSVALLDSLIAVVEPEIENEFNRWSSGNVARWETNLNSMRTFLQQRPNVVRNQIKEYFSISDTINVTVKIQGRGKVKLNSVLISEQEWQGYYMSNVPISLEAIPDFGSKFLNWETRGTDYQIKVTDTNNISITAIFDTTTSTEYKPLVINEIMYHPQLNSGGEWIELYNPNGFPIPMNGYVLTDGGEGNSFVFPVLATIAANDYLVVAESLSEFSVSFPSVNSVIGEFGSGVNGFSLSNGGENILLYNNQGALDDSVYYQDNFPWPVEADGNGSSLQLIDYNLDNSLPINWYAITNPYYSPGGKNPTNIDENGLSDMPIKVYPNPFGNTINIEINLSTIAEVGIYDISGRIVLNKNISSTNNVCNVDVSTLRKGIYIIKVGLREGTQYSAKIIKN